MALEVVGREGELAAVREALAQAKTGAAVAIVRGEPGIGKTTLWLAGIALAEQQGFRVLVSRPAEAETQLSYAGLADLLAPVLDEILDELPIPQRRALDVAMHRADAEGAAPDQAAIAFGFLGALRAAARDRPTLVAVDDVQWLDPASAFALQFAARRIREETVALLLALRTDAPFQVARWLSEERFQRIEVGPLSLGALHHLVQGRLEIVLARPALRRIHEASRGNPFFALELARSLKDRGLHVEAGEPLPISGELRQLLEDRLAGLPDECEQALLFAAAASYPTLRLLEEAADGQVRVALQPALEGQLIELEGERIRFAHPLLASAVYAGARTDGKRAAHRKLADVVADPEERARHLALSTDEADEDVAAALDEAARIARGRGAPQAAAELGEQALRLTPPGDAEAAHRRRLEAGSAHFDAGNSARADTLFTEAAEKAPSQKGRAEALSRLARAHHYAGDQRLAVRLFRECLAGDRIDASVRLDAAEGLATSLFFLREELPEALRHARFAARAAKKEGDRAGLAVALGTQGVMEAILGRREAPASLEAAMALEESARDVPFVRQPRFQRALVSVWSDDLEDARVDMESVGERALAQGDESSLPYVLTYLSINEFLLGRWEAAMRAADEAEEIASAAGQGLGRAFALSARALVVSGFGQEEAVRSDAKEALALAELGAMLATMTGRWAVGLLALSLDNAQEAHGALQPLVDHCQAAGIVEPGSMRFVPDEIEALVALGDRDAAAARLDWFEGCAQRVHRGSALAAAHRCRGLLAAASGAADEAFAEFGLAVDALERLPLPFERARTLLAFGSTQRRANQRRDARETLSAALDGFEGLGAALWTERTRAELRRISGRPPSRGDLTAAEQRVAELVADGQTNREVAAALYVTPRTVEGTLSRIYSKLGVRSRTELARRWGARHS